MLSRIGSVSGRAPALLLPGLLLLSGCAAARPPVVLPPARLAAAEPVCAPGQRDPGGDRIGFVFGGGGAKAAYEAGIALAFAERGVVPAAVAGTSSGALSAVMVATREEARLAALWRTIRRDDVFRVPAPVVFGGLLPAWLAVSTLSDLGSLLDPTPLRRTLEREVDLRRVRESPIRVLVLTADLLSGRPRRFDNGTLSVEALVASATVPGLFPPVVLPDAALVDGGIVERAPTLELLAAHPVDQLFVVLAYESDPPRGTSVREVLERVFEIALGREILRDVELARARYPLVDIHVLRPSEPLRLRPLDFDSGRLGQLVDLGRRDGLTCLDTLGRWRR